MNVWRDHAGQRTPVDAGQFVSGDTVRLAPKLNSVRSSRERSLPNHIPGKGRP